MMIVEEAAVPSFAKEGWTRPKENAAKHPLIGADGVVVSSYRLFIPKGFDDRWLETTTPSAPAKECRLFFFMAQPPLLRKEGTELARIMFRNLDSYAAETASPSLRFRISNVLQK